MSGATLRICSLNMRAMPHPPRRQITALSTLIAEQDCDVVLLQECRPEWVETVCEATGLAGYHSHWLPPDTAARAFSPDGSAIFHRPEFELRHRWRIPPEAFLAEAVHETIVDELPTGFRSMPQRLAMRYSGRSALAEISIGGSPIVVGSFHATPGTGQIAGGTVGEWKPFFPGAVAIELAGFEVPFLFGIDANEPRAETTDSVTFHWAEGRPGVEKTKALLGRDPIHRGRDLFREWFETSGNAAASDELLIATYAPSDEFQRRFDSIWATRDFELVAFETLLEEAVAAGGDHAMLVAELRLRQSGRARVGGSGSASERMDLAAPPGPVGA